MSGTARSTVWVVTYFFVSEVSAVSQYCLFLVWGEKQCFQYTLSKRTVPAAKVAHGLGFAI